MSLTPASSCPPPPSRPPQSALKLQQERLEQDSGKTLSPRPAADFARDFFKLQRRGRPLPQLSGCGGQEAGGCGAGRRAMSGGLPSWLSRRPGQGCSRVAAFPIPAARDESSPFPAAWPPFRPPPPQASVASVRPEQHRPCASGRPAKAEAPSGCWSSPACILGTGSGPQQK